MTDLNALTESELQAVIDNAAAALKAKQVSKRKEVFAEIRELAASVGATVEISTTDGKSTRKVSKVNPKYRHPENEALTWTGRGLMPKWIKELVENGHDKSEYLI